MPLEFKLPNFLSGPNLRIPGTPRFNIALLESMIEKRGVPIRWDKSLLCPCIDTVSEGPDPGCTVCNGMGVFWEEGGKELTALVTNRQWQKTQSPAPRGTYDSGSVTVSFPPCNLPAVNDRITVLCDKVVYSDEVLTKGLISPSGKSMERVLVDEILEVEKVVSIRRVPPTGTPYTTEIKEFYQGTNFDIEDKNLIVWHGFPPDNTPNEGEPYSIRYVARPQYVIFGTPMPLFRADSNTPVDQLPVRVTAQRVDFIKRNKN